MIQGRRYLLLLLVILAWPLTVLAEPERQNWFHDPFFQISDRIPDCPMPVGPFVTEDQRLTDAHHRAERGTTCWLVGKCDRPNSYAYDQDIASAFQAALRVANPFAESSLWVTVQGRVVYIEGCSVDKEMSTRLEAFARALPYVEVAVAKIHSDPAEPPPYPTLAKPDKEGKSQP
jgi:hypothetical protein